MPPEHRKWSEWKAIALGAACLLLAVVTFVAFGRPFQRQLGRALFEGSAPLKGRILGHETDLPPEAVRCSNCHPLERRESAGPVPSLANPVAAGTRRGPAAASPVVPRRAAQTSLEVTPAVEAFAPVLTRASLTLEAPRRGGPPSAYDSERFCRLLREGIDPAHVMVPRAMPRYNLSHEECNALWHYVTAR